MTTTWPSHTLRDLLAQHAELRDLVAVCELLIARLEGGAAVAGTLALEVAKLRLAFDAHNRYEERLLRPVLIEADGFGPVRIDTMIAEHVREHRAVSATLDDASIVALRATLDTLTRHLDEEERYFLSSKVLHDDLVTVEGGG